MSLYHETAEILSASSSTGGNLKTRIFGKKDLKSPQQQVYALALETCKWSTVLKEVIENSELLRHERKLTPVLALLLVHDFLLAKKGIALPASHGLRTTIERHKARLGSELTRVRLRRKAGSIEVLRQQINLDFLGEAAGYPRWVRVNALRTTLEAQLEGVFKDFTRVYTVKDVTASGSSGGKLLYVDEHIPNLLALSPGFEITKTEAYTSGAIILQDKASCFPAYLLDPRSEDGDVIDSCAAPGNKTTHLAAIVRSHGTEKEECVQKVYAFEKDRRRARTLEKMVGLADAKDMTRISFGQDFLKVDPDTPLFAHVGALLLDPSCSGSGIVGRDSMPTIHLPHVPGTFKKPTLDNSSRKRKREESGAAAEEGEGEGKNQQQPVLVDDDGQEVLVSSEEELRMRLEALSSFQLTLILHAFRFPAARKLTYSTCSVHAEENEQVVLKALRSGVARERGWRILRREHQVRGMREWPVRGSVEASNGDAEVADSCIRSYKGDGRGVMGFFVAGFVRDAQAGDENGDGPYVRDDDGRIVRDVMGMPTLKAGSEPQGSSSHYDGRASENKPSDGDGPDTGSDDVSGSSVDSSLSDSEQEEWDGFGD
ncbi:Uu.00g080420.m01.CDS01 [Anthostomella pinea]|uniref:Uu.00g080420.m01.CDS01 n=1 Tax=Anthostomella pinea TaxID=933095 RepID=A0AAI8YJ75_9PEZI|nr:Uu.00g080420.m01.CDS01 [Anthostomella pinea]